MLDEPLLASFGNTPSPMANRGVTNGETEMV
jgi:hypothetical protein